MPIDDDEIWTTRDGEQIAVGEMSESHVRNALRMVLRKSRIARKRMLENLVAKIESEPEHSFEHERPDNHAQLAELRARHGAAAVEVRPASVANIAGGDVYVNGRKIGWFGGIE